MRRALFICLLLAGCNAGAPPIAMSFARSGSLYDAPFPSDDLRRDDGSIDLSKYPNPNQVTIVDQALSLLAADARGFALAGAVYFRSGGPLDPKTLPDLNGSVGAGASVFLVDVDASQPDFLARRPIEVSFLDDGGPFGAPNLLALLPLQGVPLRPRARYAAVVTTKVRDPAGRPLPVSPALDQIVHGTKPAGLADAPYQEYRDALAALAPLLPAGQIAALAVFTTDDPTAELSRVRDDALASHPLSALKSAPVLTDLFPDYCVYQSTVDVPVYQSGTPPYEREGGAWTFDASGHPIFDHTETARVIFTVPRAPTPSGGWPTVVFVRTGGGGDRPLVDRGVCATPEFTQPITPGTGPAMEFAQVGFAGVQIDGPLGGIRNTTMGNEDFLIFNVSNAAALRDNVRQSAMELSLLARAVPSISFSAPDCPGAGAAPITFDRAHLALMGHSMGAWIAPLTLSVEPAFGAAVLSGAGASYIANVMDKQQPVEVRPFAEALLDYDMDNRSLVAADPALTLLQWAAEPSDPQVYDRRIVREPAPGEPPRQVLMLQGIVDHYILPSIANATSLALGLDEAGPAYDASSQEEQSLGQTPLGELLGFAGAQAIALPAAGNQTVGGVPVTAVVVQHPGDAVEDGHEVVFQTEPPKHQYRCFLAGFARGAASVPPDGPAAAPCP